MLWAIYLSVFMHECRSHSCLNFTLTWFEYEVLFTRRAPLTSEQSDCVLALLKRYVKCFAAARCLRQPMPQVPQPRAHKHSARCHLPWRERGYSSAGTGQRSGSTGGTPDCREPHGRPQGYVTRRTLRFLPCGPATPSADVCSRIPSAGEYQQRRRRDLRCAGICRLCAHVLGLCYSGTCYSTVALAWGSP